MALQHCITALHCSVALALRRSIALHYIALQHGNAALHYIIALQRCIAALHCSIAFQHCIAALHRRTALLHCTAALDCSFVLLCVRISDSDSVFESQVTQMSPPCMRFHVLL